MAALITWLITEFVAIHRIVIKVLKRVMHNPVYKAAADTVHCVQTLLSAVMPKLADYDH